MEREAKFSPDRIFRYLLTIQWDKRLPWLNFLMLNPSTADEFKNDPTVQRCMRRAMMWGYGGLVVTNLFAYRATDPKMLEVEMWGVDHAETHAGRVTGGFQNDAHIASACAMSEATICAWGVDGCLFNRDSQVLGLLEEYADRLHYLKLNTGMIPAHPLYLAYNILPKPFWKDAYMMKQVMRRK